MIRSAAANRHDGREPLGVRQAQDPTCRSPPCSARSGKPGSCPPHSVAMTSSSRPSSTSLDQISPSGHWGDTTMKGKSGCLVAILGGPCVATFQISRAALARPVQEEHQRPAPFTLGLVALGQEQQVVHLRAQRLFELELLSAFASQQEPERVRAAAVAGQTQQGRRRQIQSRISHTWFSSKGSAAVSSGAFHVAGQAAPAYMIFSFGKSCESTRPTGSRFAFTTIKSSMFRSLKIFNASTASASSRMQIGLRVITFLSGRASRFSPAAMRRRKSPSVNTPTSLPRAFTTLRLPDLARGHHQQRFLDREVFARRRRCARRCA